MRSLTIVGDGSIALLGAFALRAMGASWTDVVVLAVIAVGLTMLVRERPFASRRHRPRRLRRPHRGPHRQR